MKEQGLRDQRTAAASEAEKGALKFKGISINSIPGVSPTLPKIGSKYFIGRVIELKNFRDENKSFRRRLCRISNCIDEAEGVISSPA